MLTLSCFISPPPHPASQQHPVASIYPGTTAPLPLPVRVRSRTRADKSPPLQSVVFSPSVSESVTQTPRRLGRALGRAGGQPRATHLCLPASAHHRVPGGGCVATRGRLGSQQTWHLTVIPGDCPPPAARGSPRCRICWSGAGGGRRCRPRRPAASQDNGLGKGYGIISRLFFLLCYPGKPPVGLRRGRVPEIFGVEGVSRCNPPNFYFQEGTEKS